VYASAPAVQANSGQKRILSQISQPGTAATKEGEFAAKDRKNEDRLSAAGLPIFVFFAIFCG